jgi:cobalt-precorrin-5B (C1)-methyltransferase
MESRKLRKAKSLSASEKAGGKLRKGFSTGTAMTAAARAALRCILTGEGPKVVAVRLPAGYFLPILIDGCFMEGGVAVARVIKDGGDDPDVTHKAAIRAKVRFVQRGGVMGSVGRDRDAEPCSAPIHRDAAGICLIGGEGVGVVTKPGLPVAMGEPAVNPVPRQMLSQNLADELAQSGLAEVFGGHEPARGTEPEDCPGVFIPFEGRILPPSLLLEVVVEVEKGAELARHTLNPRLGIEGGISILGTTGIVKPFSHKAYEETIQTALSVAASNGCREVVLSTGGKSERFAQQILADYPSEAFVQVADFFAFSIREALRMGFSKVVHSAFFGKVVKMAQGHEYTHAHKVALDLNPVAELAREMGYDEDLCRELAAANTARHALELLLSHQATDLIAAVARGALRESRRIGEEKMAVRLLLFDYDGALLADLEE